jgi:UDP-2-acetamido-3-amino-2,3-dideoxy-glucuronate N-acetyltransferase
MAHPVRVAVVGGGHWGKNLVRNIAALGALECVCDREPDTLSALTTEYQVRGTANFAEVLGDRGITAVMIATPAEHHYRMAREALAAGKDTFVEKPLALRVEEARALSMQADAAGRVLMVGHLLAYHPAVQRLKELIDAGELGQLRYLYSNRLNLGRFRTEENILWSFAPHDIAVMLRLLGEDPTRVSAHGGNYLHTDIADVTVSALEFASDARAHIFVSWLHPFKEHKLVVVGAKQMAVFDDTAADKLVLFPHRIEWLHRRPVPQAADRVVVPLEPTEPLAAECAHFLACVAERRRPSTDGEEGVRVIRVLDACQNSLARQGAVVPIGDRPALDYFVDPTATVDPGATIGTGTKIWHYSHVLAGAVIGSQCSFGQNTVVMPGVRVGNNVKVQNNVSLFTGVILEDDVFCGPSLTFTNVTNPRSAIPRRDEYRSTLVRTGATLGANATIVCGHTIGRYAFVGAGAVVTRDVADYALVVGNPARQVGWMCACGVRLQIEHGRGSCGACGTAYVLDGTALQPLATSPTPAAHDR